jgi:hypothetical protein
MAEINFSEFDLPEEEVNDTLRAVFDKSIAAADPERKKTELRSLAADTRLLSFRQRLYLRYLFASQMRIRAAVNKMNQNLDIEPIKEGTVRSWHKDQNFKSIIERYTQLMLETTGIGSASRILLRIDGVVEDALTPVPVLHQGLPVFDPDRPGEILKEVDRGSALKGLEMLGKAAGAFRKDEENSQRVTVVLDFSGEQMQGEQESEVIDGEFVEVKK